MRMVGTVTKRVSFFSGLSEHHNFSGGNHHVACFSFRTTRPSTKAGFHARCQGARQKWTLLANGLESQSSKTGNARTSRRIIHQPGQKTSDIHGGCGDHMLQMRLGLPKVATATKTKHADALRNGAFHPCAFGITLLECLGLLPRTRHLNGLMVSLRAEGDLTRVGGSGRTLGTYGTSQAIVFAELGTNHVRQVW